MGAIFNLKRRMEERSSEFLTNRIKQLFKLFNCNRNRLININIDDVYWREKIYNEIKKSTSINFDFINNQDIQLFLKNYFFCCASFSDNALMTFS